MKNKKKFIEWLTRIGCEILPLTNQWEELRFKGSETAVYYTSGKTSGKYADHAYRCFKNNKLWNGGPVKTGRHKGYKKQKEQILKRDGDRCFFCGEKLGEDITLEHLIAISNGGSNSLMNMALAHEKCNNDVDNLPLNIKTEIAVKKRSERRFNQKIDHSKVNLECPPSPDTISRIASNVAHDFKMGGLTDSIYEEFAREIVNQYLETLKFKND